MSCKNLQMMQNELDTIINNNNSTSQNYEDFYKKWGINYTIDANVKNIAQCSTINAAIGSNKLEIPQSCVDAATNLCLGLDSKGKGSPAYDECWKLYRPSMRNINQSNVNMITSNCMVSSLLKDPVLKKNKELSLILNMNIAKQKIDCDDSKSNTFNNAISSKEKIISMSDCINNNVVNQMNYISVCNASDVVQKNISDVVSNCAIISGDAPIEDHKKPNFISSNNNSDKSINQNDNDSTSSTFNNYYLIIGSICSCCCCLSIIIIIVIIMNKK
jgi:hypothetical protein